MLSYIIRGNMPRAAVSGTTQSFTVHQLHQSRAALQQLTAVLFTLWLCTFGDPACLWCSICMRMQTPCDCMPQWRAGRTVYMQWLSIRVETAESVCQMLVHACLMGHVCLPFPPPTPCYCAAQGTWHFFFCGSRGTFTAECGDPQLLPVFLHGFDRTVLHSCIWCLQTASSQLWHASRQ
jgi:hypothetical protein